MQQDHPGWVQRQLGTRDTEPAAEPGRPEGQAETSEWVLAPFDAEETAALPGRLSAAAEALEAALREGVVAAMNRFNRDPSDAAEKPVE